MNALEQARTAARRERAWWLLLASLLCCVLEGAVRKWLAGDESAVGRLAYVSKYLLMALFLVSTARSDNRLAYLAKPFMAFGLALIGIGAVVSSFAGVELIGAVLTALNFLILPAAAWQAGRQLPADAVRRFAQWSAAIAVAMAPLTVLQFYAPASSILNRYSTEGEFIATAGVSERIRATGTFSYISGLGEFASVAVWAGIVCLATAKTSRTRWLGYAGLIAGLCCTFVTVSRAVALMSLALVGVWALSGGQVRRKVQTVVSIAIVGAALLAVSGRWESALEIGSTVLQRHEGAGRDTIAYRLWYAFVMPLDAAVIAPLGNGIGTEQAGRTLGFAGLRGGWTYESPWGRTIMELGVLGFLGLIVSWGIVIVPWREAYRLCPVGSAKTALWVTAAAMAMRALLGYQFNHVAAYFFWAMAACILALGNSPAFSASPDAMKSRSAQGASSLSAT